MANQIVHLALAALIGGAVGGGVAGWILRPTDSAPKAVAEDEPGGSVSGSSGVEGSTW